MTIFPGGENEGYYEHFGIEAEKALAVQALSANKSFAADKASHVLLDVELMFKNASGEWEAVTYENFPSEGVETVLPYPEGTNKAEFDYTSYDNVDLCNDRCSCIKKKKSVK